MEKSIKSDWRWLLSFIVLVIIYLILDLLGIALTTRKFLLSPISVPLALIGWDNVVWLDGESGGYLAMCCRLLVFSLEVAFLLFPIYFYIRTKQQRYLLVIIFFAIYIVMISCLTFTSLYGNKPGR